MSVVVLVFLGCVIACLVGHLAILHSVIRQRVEPANTDVPRPRMHVELVWALIPALALALVLTATWARVREHATPRPGVIMKIAR
jgi:heme/copper-type cytochrome/quinol oxidase subunit 2